MDVELFHDELKHDECVRMLSSDARSFDLQHKLEYQIQFAYYFRNIDRARKLISLTTDLVFSFK